MFDSIWEFLESLGEAVKEILATISNFAAILSIVWGIIGLLELISQQGLVQGYIS